MPQTGAICIMKIKRKASVSFYITEALLALLKEKDYQDISITELCEKADVTRTSFYRNFKSKEDILFKRVRTVTDAFLEESAISYEGDSTRDYFVKLFTHMERQKELCQAAAKAGLLHLVKDEFDRVFQTVHRKDYDPYKSYFLSGGVYNVFLLWFVNGCKETPRQMADKMNDIFVK